jgi:hypothetical protein
VKLKDCLGKMSKSENPRKEGDASDVLGEVCTADDVITEVKKHPPFFSHLYIPASQKGRTTHGIVW